MSDQPTGKVAIVDYDCGNLFSVQQACAYVGLRAEITSSSDKIWKADAVILPGVGAFGNAMATLEKLDLVTLLKDVAASGKTFVGICLGMQLLMSESSEFSNHQGLGIVEGQVSRLEESSDGNRILKVPQVGWNSIHSVVTNHSATDSNRKWTSTLMDGIPDGSYMYFVHSYSPTLVDPALAVSSTKYGNTEFVSSFQYRSIFACQYHPERSGPTGLRFYRNLATKIAEEVQGPFHA